MLREMLMAKFGREFAQDVMDNKDSCVPERVMNKLLVDAPDPKLVDLYIFEICKAYDVPFSSPHLPETKVEQDEEQVEEEVGEGEKVTSDGADKEEVAEKESTQSTSSAKAVGATHEAKQPDAAPPRKKTDKEEYDSLEARFAALKCR